MRNGVSTIKLFAIKHLSVFKMEVFMKRLSVFGMGGLRILQSFFNKQSSGHLSSTKSYLKFGLYFESVAAFFAFCYLFIGGFSAVNIATAICAGLTALMFFFELITSLRAMKGAPLALCTMCALGGGIILPTIAGIFFFDEPMTLIQWLGVVVFFASAYFLMPREEKKISIGKVAVIVLISNFLINGIISIVGKFFAMKVDPAGEKAALFACLSYAFAALVFASVLLVMSLGSKKDASDTSAKKTFLPKPLFIYGGAVGLVCASIVYFSTLLSRPGWIPIVELNTIPNAICLVGSLAIEIIFFGGKLTVGKIVGIVLNIASMMIIILF